MRIHRGLGVSVCLLGSIAIARPASSSSITFDHAQGGLSASVVFEAIGSNLRVTLTNTSQADVMVPTDVLTAVFFTISGADAPALAPISAIIGAGSTIYFGGTDPGGVVGGEWAYSAGLTSAPGGAGRGISSTGLDLFGAGNFPGSNLQGPLSVDGLQYGLTSSGDDATTGNAAVTGRFSLTKNQVVFVLSGLPDGFDPTERIGSIFFQYGTSLNELGVPEPASGPAILMSGLVLARRHRARNPHRTSHRRL